MSEDVKRVLIIEDDAEARASLKGFLEAAPGFDVSVADADLFPENEAKTNEKAEKTAMKSGEEGPAIQGLFTKFVYRF